MDEESVLNAQEFFLGNLEIIDRAIAYACRSASLFNADADDFASVVKVKLIEHDYAILRAHDKESSFPAFISVVVHRLLLDHRTRLWGKWHASSEAKRLGDAAIAVEAMVLRDGYTVEAALPALRRRWPDLSQQQVEQLIAQLPSRRKRPREVELDTVLETPHEVLQPEQALFEYERVERSRNLAAIIRAAIARLPEDDRLPFRLHFEASMTIAEVARVMRVPQKPLYGRINRCLRAFRKELEAHGFSAADAEDVLDTGSRDLDFGFGAGNVSILPSISSRPEGGEEGS